ncbi:hypothetical protein NS506_04927 [Nocardia seriolae]|nr:hypothetical protein NS506_04927 [Nocardia seriolae]
MATGHADNHAALDPPIAPQSRAGVPQTTENAE